MPVDQKSASHICNVIKRQIQEEYPELTLTFILHEDGKRRQAIARAIPRIQDHPAGETIIAYINKNKPKKAEESKSFFAGLAIHQNSGFLTFFRSFGVLGIFYVNCSRFDTENDLRNHAYHMVWHALALYEDIKASHEKRSSKTPSAAAHRLKNVDGVFLPVLKPQLLYHRNLTADIFSASIQKLLQKDDAIKNLARQRMHDTLTPKPGFIAEKFPFPICMETLELLFSESIKYAGKKGKLLPQAVTITRDIGITYSLKSIEQWKSFSRPAQEMAWAGFDPETILGAAIYTSENTYTRAIADMVAENLEVKPELISSLNDYNPFTDQEANTRLHLRSCKDNMLDILSRIRTPADGKILLKEASKQNRCLLSGHPAGWCANALIRAMDVIEESTLDDMSRTKERAQKDFLSVLAETHWPHIHDFTETLFVYRRNGLDITIENAIQIAEKNENFAFIQKALETTKTYDDAAQEEVPQNRKNITSFISSNAIKT